MGGNQWAVGSGQWIVGSPDLFSTHCPLPTAHCPLPTSRFNRAASWKKDYHCLSESNRMSQKFSDIVDALAARGWALRQDFLPIDAIEALVEEARQLWLAGRFTHAGVGHGSERQIRSDVRGDHILWLDESESTPAQAPYWSEIESLRAELNRELFLGLVSVEAHYAFYPPGAFYQKHVDRFSDSDERAISCSLYLNSDWKEEDGGQLLLYAGDHRIEIFPRAGAFVIFRSDNVPHEVAPAERDRFSLTSWLRRRSSRNLPG